MMKSVRDILRMPAHLEVASLHLHRGTPDAAWPTILARFMRKPFVAASEEVIPP